VLIVNGLQLASGTDAATSSVALIGLELPRLVGVAVAEGDAPSVDDARGLGGGTPAGQGAFPVPVVPESC
jgi:hypothetical protein